MNNKTKKLCIASILCTVAIIGSMFSIPVFGSKCSPIQHMVNILCAVALGPWYGIGVAFTASLIRNILGIGSIWLFQEVCLVHYFVELHIGNIKA